MVDKRKIFPTYYKAKEAPGKIADNIASADVGAAARKGVSGAASILRYPYEVARGKGVVLKTIWNILKFILISALGIIIIFGGILGGLFVYNYFYRAGEGASILKHAGVGLEETGVAGAAKLGVLDIFKVALNPEKAGAIYGFQSEIEDNADKKELGVKMTNLEQVGGRAFSGKDVIIRGVITAQSLTSELTSSVRCEMDGYKGDAKVEISGTEGDSIKIYKDVPQTFTATCVFPNGITVDDLSKIKLTKIAKMYVAYDFTTKAMHNTYFLSKKSADSLISKGVDPFVYYKVSDPLLKSDRTVRSVTTQGPVNLGIGTFDSQPFSENIPYYLGVTLTNNNDWFGNLKELKDVLLYMPPNINLAGEGGIQGDCDFYNTGDLDEDGFKVYSLNSNKLEQANKDCSKKALSEQLIGEEQCLNLFKNNINYMCKFVIAEGLDEDNIFKDIMRVESSYIYETSKSVAVDVYNLPGA